MSILRRSHRLRAVATSLIRRLPAMAGRIVLFGATGYTGTLVAEELAAQGVAAGLAGRNRERLEALRSRLIGDFTIETADVAAPATVAALVGAGDVLVSTVGPFARFGRPAVSAAVTRGAHYLDSTGEPSFVRSVFDDFGPGAERAGVVLLPAFGYDCVPGHVAGALPLEDAGAAAVQVDIGYFSSGGRMSGGTLASLAGAAGAPGFSWRNGRLVTERGGGRTSSFGGGGRPARAPSLGGTGPRASRGATAAWSPSAAGCEPRASISGAAAPRPSSSGDPSISPCPGATRACAPSGPTWAGSGHSPRWSGWPAPPSRRWRPCRVALDWSAVRRPGCSPA